MIHMRRLGLVIVVAGTLGCYIEVLSIFLGIDLHLDWGIRGSGYRPLLDVPLMVRDDNLRWSL